MTIEDRPHGRITPLERSEQQDRRDQRLPCAWVSARAAADPGTQRAAPGPRAAPGAPVTPDTSRTLNDAGAVDAVIRPIDAAVRIDGPSLIVALATPAPPEALEPVRAAAERGARIYAMVADEQDTEALDRVLPGGGPMLVRRVRHLPASFLLGHRGRGGVLFAGPPGAAPAWQLRLTPAQQGALWRVALRWFWHDADGEACWTGTGRSPFASPAARPFDAPLPVPGAPVHVTSHPAARPAARVAVSPVANPAERPTASPAAPTLWHAPDATLPPPGDGLRTVMVPPSGAAHQALCALVDAGAEVLHADTRLPFFTAGAGAGVLELARGPSAHRLRVVLEPAQAAVLAELAHAASARATWRFRVTPALGELAGPVWLAGAPAPAELIDCQAAPCGRALAPSLRAMPGTPPSTRPAPAVLARAVRWTWTVDPPRVPASAREDALVSAWKVLDTDVARRLGEVRASLATTATQAGSLGKQFAALAGALLGFGRTRATLLQALDELAAPLPSSLGPSGARELLSRLEALEERTRGLRSGLEQAEAKAAEDEDREQQRRDWQQRRDDAVARLPRIQAEHAAAERQLDAVHAERGDLSAIPEKDRKARKQKLHGDQHRLDQQIKQLAGQESELRRRVEQPFEFRPRPRPSPDQPGRGSNRYVPPAEPATIEAVPAEPLPAVGSLWIDRSTRYLVIEQWDDLEQGEEEARRLRAQLVAPKEQS
jgi:hypothetical protein